MDDAHPGVRVLQGHAAQVSMGRGLEIAVFGCDSSCGMPGGPAPGGGVEDVLVSRQELGHEDHGKSIEKELTGRSTANDSRPEDNDLALGVRHAGAGLVCEVAHGDPDDRILTDQDSLDLSR